MMAFLTSCGASMGHPSGLHDAVPAGEKVPNPDEPEDHALGRSRGGWGSKIHILCDGKGHPLHFELSAGQVHDSTMLDAILVGADGSLQDKYGRPRAWPVALAGDKGYRAAWIDAYLMRLGIVPVIPNKNGDREDNRPVPFDKAAYRRRSIVEQLIGWLKESRRIVTRFEKTAINFGGMIKLAFIHRYLRLSGA
jgi:transposase